RASVRAASGPQRQARANWGRDRTQAKATSTAQVSATLAAWAMREAMVAARSDSPGEGSKEVGAAMKPTDESFNASTGARERARKRMPGMVRRMGHMGAPPERSRQTARATTIACRPHHSARATG